MSKHILFVSVVLFIFLMCLVPSSSRADTAQEVEHLLSAIEESECTFIRNGKEYMATIARKHIAMKYDRVKSRVEKTEDFIRLVATRSSMSGKPYMVRCNGNDVFTAEWLTAKLQTYRRK